MKKLISLFIFTAVAAQLSACGVKGPLYFPQQDNQQQTEQTQ